jgi:hypothetical protein
MWPGRDFDTFALVTLQLNDFREQFDKAVQAGKVTWQVIGFYGADGKVYPFGTDTKVLSTVFEALAAPIIVDIAGRSGYTVESSPQTVYPDFTLNPAGQSGRRIAVDIKTTYRKSSSAPLVYTLGSYTSFLRNGTKNILHPYSQYDEHWVIGFVYNRRVGVSSKSHVGDAPVSSLECPYEDVSYFIQDKFRIAGLRPASGNTANIGSLVSANLDDFKEGRGPFAKHGKEVFEGYWRHYTSGAGREYQSVEQFLQWKGSHG